MPYERPGPGHHLHRCPGCQWNWVCTCPDPENHHGFCFECQPGTAPAAEKLTEDEVLKRWDLEAG